MRVAPSRAFRVGTMHDNIRLKPQRFELSLSPKQVGAFLIAVLVVLGSAFALGLGIGRKTDRGAAQPLAAPRDALAPLDEALAAREGPPPELNAHQALTDSRSIDKAMAVPTVKSVKAPGASMPQADGKVVHEMAAPPSLAVSPTPSPAASPPIATTPPIATPPIATTPPSAIAISRPLSATPSSPRREREGKPSPRIQTSKRSASPDPRQSSSKGAYTIQIASASSRADAERLAKQLAARNPRIVTADVPGMGRRYRVQIGAFDSREAAKRQAVSLSEAGVRGLVTPSH